MRVQGINGIVTCIICNSLQSDINFGTMVVHMKNINTRWYLLQFAENMALCMDTSVPLHELSLFLQSNVLFGLLVDNTFLSI